MKKVAIFLVLVLLLGLIAYAVMGNPVVFYHNFALQRAMSQVPEGEVTLNQIVPFAWDAAYTFPPYTSKKEIETALGFSSASIRETVNEGMVQLLFVKDGRVTASVCGYPERLGYQVCFSDRVSFSEEAVFTAKRTEGVLTLIRREAQDP